MRSSRAATARERADELTQPHASLSQRMASFDMKLHRSVSRAFVQIIVNSACRRALTGHLSGTGLALELIASSERRTFADIVNAWTVGIAHIRNSVSADANSQTVKENVNV